MMNVETAQILSLGGASLCVVFFVTLESFAERWHRIHDPFQLSQEADKKMGASFVCFSILSKIQLRLWNSDTVHVLSTGGQTSLICGSGALGRSGKSSNLKRLSVGSRSLGFTKNL